MTAVVAHPRGTAHRAAGRDAEYTMAGKTGTAQVVGIAQGAKYDASILTDFQKDHALFVSFAPVEKPKIAIAVIVENGGSGSGAAAPVARQVSDFYLLGSDANADAEVSSQAALLSEPSIDTIEPESSERLVNPLANPLIVSRINNTVNSIGGSINVSN